MMSLNLVIYKIDRTSQEAEPLGNLQAVTDALNGAFIDLEWESPVTASLPADLDGGFRVKLTMQGGKVRDVYTDASANHIRQFAGLCNREGWRMADAQEREDLDIDDPQKLYLEQSGQEIPHGAPSRTTRPLHGQRPASASARVLKWGILFLLGAGLIAFGFYLWRQFGG